MSSDETSRLNSIGINRLDDLNVHLVELRSHRETRDFKWRGCTYSVHWLESGARFVASRKADELKWIERISNLIFHRYLFLRPTYARQIENHLNGQMERNAAYAGSLRKLLRENNGKGASANAAVTRRALKAVLSGLEAIPVDCRFDATYWLVEKGISRLAPNVIQPLRKDGWDAKLVRRIFPVLAAMQPAEQVRPACWALSNLYEAIPLDRYIEVVDEVLGEDEYIELADGSTFPAACDAGQDGGTAMIRIRRFRQATLDADWNACENHIRTLAYDVRHHALSFAKALFDGAREYAQGKDGEVLSCKIVSAQGQETTPGRHRAEA